MLLFLLEDDPDDQKLFAEALADVDPAVMLSAVANGQAAFDALNNSVLKPDLIFADINVPLVNGIEFLRAIRQTDHLHDIPVIMLSTSRQEAHISKIIHELNAQFFTKPSGFNELCGIIRESLSLISSSK